MRTRNSAALALIGALVAAPATAEHHEAEAADTTAVQEIEEAPAVKSEPAASQGSVARAQFALEVIDREPTDALRRLDNDHDQIFFFTELHQFEGQVVIHRWEFGGEVKAEVPLSIGGPRWRAYSSKALDSSWLGTWTVSVVDAAGSVVAQESFDYVEAPVPVASEEPAATDPSPASPAE
jgi:hypothetical protein